MKHLFAYCLLLLAYAVYADMPGNKPRPSYNIKITGLQQYKDYTFYSETRYSSAAVIEENSVVNVPGGFGAPQCIYIWAVNNKTDLHTDTIYFCSGDERKSMTIIVEISDNHLSYEKNAIKKGEEGFVADVIDGGSNGQSKKNQHIMYLISIFSFLFMLALVFFVWSKKREFNNRRLI